MKLILKINDNEHVAINKNFSELHLENCIANIGDNMSYSEVVYADKEYDFIIQNEHNLEFSEDDISIFVNGMEMDINANSIKKNEKENTIIFQLCDKKPFKFLYGLAKIVITIKEKVFQYNPVAIAVNDYQFNENEISIRKMLEEILLDEQKFLYTKEGVKNTGNQIGLHNMPNLHNEIGLLKKIINVYNQMFYSFSINPYVKNSYAYMVDKTEKLRFVDYKIIQHIISNPQELRYNNAFTGILYNKMPIAPTKTLIKNVIKDVNTYENQQVLGFLEAIFEQVNNRLSEINKIKKYNKDNSLKDKIKSPYKLSTQIINLYTETRLNDHMEEYLKIKEDILMLKNKYLKCFPIKASVVTKIPKTTAVFMEIFHYRQIFSVIKEWFSLEKILIPENNLILNFPSADIIYEIYTLLYLYKNLLSLGYINIEQKNCKYQTDFFSKTKINNIYRFKKGTTIITVFYQPVIGAENNITGLYRLDPYPRSKYYQPDFIIKKEIDNKVEFTILDSKWSSLENLLPRKNNRDKNYRIFEECVYKYYFSVARQDNHYPINRLWLINGKANKTDKTIYKHRSNKEFNINDENLNRAGIVSLNPECDKKDFKDIIKHIIE